MIIALAGIICSALASLDCRFLYFKNNSDEASNELEGQFDGATEAYVGIFEYKLETLNFQDVLNFDGCKSYGEKFDSVYEVIVTSQICAIAGPALAALGLLTLLFESCIATNFGCFLLSTICFLAASGCQAGTFALYAEPSFCIDGPHECGVGLSAYMSIGATVAFWFACVLQCCFPRPDPFCDYKRRQDTEKRKEESEFREAPRSPRSPRSPRNRRVVYEEEYEEYAEDEEEPVTPPKPKSKKKKKKSKRDLTEGGLDYVGHDKNDKITKDDFKDAPAVDEGVDRVEFKEKAFPDGSRQVDEITYYEDGTKSVNTKTYGPGE